MDIEIEELSTWPEDFSDLAKQNKSLILSYHGEDKRISEQRKSGILLPPPNFYTRDYNCLLDDLDKILFQHKIIGYHCTRLIKSEISNIKSEGLKILSKTLVLERIQSALQQGLLTTEEFASLTNSPHVQASLNDEYGRRIGSLWFCPNRSTLKDSSAVDSLLGLWGGEALYNCFEDQSPISRTLEKIGVPCIVMCSISFADINHFSQNLAACFISYMVADEIENPEPPYAFDMFVERNLISTDVKDIIEISNPRFEHLTGHSNWPTQYKIDC